MVRKTSFAFGSMIFLLVLGVFAISAQEVQISPEVVDYVGDFVSKRGINPQEINNIQEVDFNNLPKEVNIENVGDHNLAIYEIDYDDEGINEKIFMITYSVEELRAQGDIIIAHDKRQFLDFGFDGVMNESGFLDTATGVETSLEKGYVMVRDGSITAVSTNMEVVQNNTGSIEIIVYKNGVAIGFGNTLDTTINGVKSDYDVQSKDTVTFEAGDVISVYVKAEGEIIWRDVITMVEITTIG